MDCHLLRILYESSFIEFFKIKKIFLKNREESANNCCSSKFMIYYLGEHKISEYPSSWKSSNTSTADEKTNGWNTVYLVVMSFAIILFTAFWIPKLLLGRAWKMFNAWPLAEDASLGRSSYTSKTQEINYSSPIELASGCVQVFYSLTERLIDSINLINL